MDRNRAVSLRRHRSAAGLSSIPRLLHLSRCEGVAANSLSGNNAKEKPKMMKSYFTVAGTRQVGTSLPRLESNKRRFADPLSCLLRDYSIAWGATVESVSLGDAEGRKQGGVQMRWRLHRERLS